MNKEHKVIVIPGLGDEIRWMKLATNHWRRHGLEPIVCSVGWRDLESSFASKQARLLDIVDTFVSDGYLVSIVGTSAGASAALNTFMERKKIIYRVVNVCGRIRVGPTTGFRTFEAMTASSPAFAQSVKLFEQRESSLNKQDRQRIMTVRARFGDELVPPETVAISGALNISIPTVEHMASIGLALTLFSNLIINFLKDGLD